VPARIVHRFEDWAGASDFPHLQVHKAHYILLNIECDQKTLAELTGSFRFSDAVLRNLVVKMTSRHRAFADGARTG